jgi:hypothetical protein
MTGKDGFKPDIVKNDGVTSYNGDTDLMGSHTTMAQKAYTDEKASAMVDSDKIGSTRYGQIARYITSNSGTTTSYEENGETITEETGILS